MSSTYTGSNTAQRVTTLGYGLDDITRARQGLQRTSALERFNLNRQFKDLATQQKGRMNQRGMTDSGVAKKASERLQGDKQLASWNLESQVMEAQAQLDRQQALLENQFAGGQIDDLIADAMRRFGVAQTLQGLVGG
tara:strand:+ start:90 stop:500 length:411 start_codon:yes stop_codon:yes gene_type:complete